MKHFGIALMSFLMAAMSAGARAELIALDASTLEASEAEEVTVLDFDAVPPFVFQTDPLVEDGFVLRVDSGHYDIDLIGSSQVFNIDDLRFGLATITLSRSDGRAFDVLSFDVATAAVSPMQFSITAVGGGGGDVFAPTDTGTVVFGPEFERVSALVIRQNEPGFFAFDDLTLRVPEPGGLVLLSLGLVAFRRRVQRGWRRCADVRREVE